MGCKLAHVHVVLGVDWARLSPVEDNAQSAELCMRV